MTWTQNKGFSTQATGANVGTWGDDSSTPTANSSTALNEGVTSLVDQALGGTTTLTLSGAATTNLTQLQTQNGMLRVTGTLTGNQIVQPAGGVLMNGFYAWENVTTGAFTVTLTNSAGSVVLPQGRRGFVWIDTTNGPRIIGIAGVTNGDPIPVGTVMLFYQAAAPSGWTISALDNYGIAVGAGIGGQTFGSVQYTVLFNRTATDAHTLTTNEIPSHTHVWGVTNPLNAASGGSSSAAGGINSTYQTAPTGGGAGHTHDIDMRVQTAYMIMATKT